MSLTTIKKSLIAASSAIALTTSVQAADVIDVLALYTDGVEARYACGVGSRINQVISVSNKVYQDSNLDVRLRLVHHEKVNYSDTNHPENALRALSCDLNEFQRSGNCNRGNAFKHVSALRDQYGADVVVLLRPYASSHNGTCGIAWVGGNGTNGDFSNPLWRETGMSVVGLDGPCADWVTTHELGHNMGLNHGAKQDSRGGTFSHAWGYGKNDDFATIMGYAWVYGQSTKKAFKFSSPLLDCFGSACGITRSKSNGADAVHALSITGPQVANYTNGVVEGGVIETPVDEGTPSTGGDPVEEARVAWEKEKAILADITAERKAVKKVYNAAKKLYTNAVKAYEKAVKGYDKSLAKTQKYYDQAKEAVDAYNNSGNLSYKEQEKLYKKAISRIKRYEKQVDKHNELVATIQNGPAEIERLTPDYERTKADYEAIHQVYLAQKAKVKEAHQAYKDAKKAAKNG